MTQMTINSFLLFLVTLSLLGCVHYPSPVLSPEMQARLKAEGISEDLAHDRAGRISHLSYKLDLRIDPKEDKFHGTCVMDFSLREPHAPLMIDFRGKTVEHVQVNGTAIAINQVASHLEIDYLYLIDGKNQIEIDYTAGIGAAGEGIIRVEDKDDGSTYLYTLNVPADAHRVFPCFDQPDLKATFELHVSLPAVPPGSIPRTVVSNATRISITTPDDESPNTRDEYSFARTKPISTYLFAFAIGHLHEIQSTGNGRPMSFYGRKSQKKLMETHAPDIFRLHQQACEFLESWFGIDYPFPKFEFVCVPDFPFSGMEHPGCIFYGEDPMLFRSSVSKLREARRADLIAHETAHMWFGDLVTMPWFDDVWLKEGYATFMAHKTLETLIQDVDHDAAFFLRNYPSALETDVTEGSAPMRQPLANMDDAKSNYGPIIYRKGPAVLRALEYMIGADAFQRGSRLFLERHAFGNGSWVDLRFALEDAWGKGRDSLKAFGESWIEQGGAPTVVSTLLRPKDGKSQLIIKQQASSGKERSWPLALEACWFNDKGNIVSKKQSFARPNVVVKNIEGARDFSFANFKNRAYARFELDQNSRRYVLRNFSAFQDQLLRAMLWESLWSAVENNKLDPATFVSFANEHLFTETDQRLLSLVLGRLQTIISRYLNDEQRQAASLSIEDSLTNAIEGKIYQKGTRLLLLRRFISFARSKNALKKLVSLAEGNYNSGGLKISNRDRWNAITRLMLLGDSRADSLLEMMSANDSGDEARRRIFLVECARGTPESKAEMYRRFFEDKDLPERWVQDGAAIFFASEQASLTDSFLEDALDRLEWIKANRKIFFLAAWSNAVIKSRLSSESAHTIGRYLEEKSIPADIRRKVLVPLYHLKRTIAVRKSTGASTGA